MRPDRALLRQEFDRKIFHVAWALLPLLYYLGYPRDCLLILLLVELLIWAGIEELRRKGYSLIPAGLMREHEKKGAPIGTLYQIASLFLAVLFFDREIAILAMLFCCVGDSVAAFAGVLLMPYLGRDRTAIRTYASAKGASLALAEDLRHALAHRKSVLLMFLTFTVCTALGFLVFPSLPALVLLAGGTGAVIADAFAWRVLGITLNDDLTIPVVSGALMSFATFL